MEAEEPERLYSIVEPGDILLSTEWIYDYDNDDRLLPSAHKVETTVSLWSKAE
jgi:hypothetical protein